MGVVVGHGARRPCSGTWAIAERESNRPTGGGSRKVGVDRQDVRRKTGGPQECHLRGSVPVGTWQVGPATVAVESFQGRI